MPDCCHVGDLDEVFTPSQARSDAEKYRRSGVDAEASRIADAVRRSARGQFTLLEIGGGIGALQIELLRSGAGRATNVELSESYESFARELANEAGVAERIDRRVGDFVTEAPTVPAADAVVMQRVVCCYPYANALVSAAADHARRVLVMTLPRDVWFVRAAIGLANLWPRLRAWKFRAYVHPTREVVDAAVRTGMRLAERRPGLIWQMLVLTRDAAN